MSDISDIYERQINDVEILNYPHNWSISREIRLIKEEYDEIEEGSRLYDKIESIMGRIMLKRSSGKNLYFYTLKIDGNDFQIMSDVNSYSSPEEFYKIHNMLSRGDIIGAKGYIGKTKKGELSLVPSEIVLLTPCLHILPGSHYGIEDKEIRYSNRYLDMIVNSEIREIFIKRHKIINFIRTYFINRDFIEVETPVLSGMAGGATAKPFKTYHNALKQEMYMRIAPELYLKQCVIGGISRVFEIGKQFRNESIDVTHNPEFTSIELYEAGSDYMKLMEMTEDLLEKLSLEINGSYEASWMGVGVSLKGPYPRLDIMETLEKEIRKRLGEEDYKLPEMTEENYKEIMLRLQHYHHQDY